MSEEQENLQVDNRKTVLKVEHVAKSFRLPTEQASGLKQAIINWTKGISGFKMQHVLRDINFEVKEGDFFGIVGRNGSGKSTLLKLISGIYMPDKGSVTVNGKLVSFIELGVGFNPELTGRENVYLNGALLGFSHEEIDAMYNDIVEFSELSEFMDQKLKNYSSGMQVRLAFAVAIKARGDILVLDEVLAVGDEAFQRKCDNYFSQIKKDPTKTVILVTHSMDAVKKYCNKAILIKNGEIIVSGNQDDVADRYTLENFQKKDSSDSNDDGSEYPTGLSKRVPTLKVNILSSSVADGVNPLKFEIEYDYSEEREAYIGIALLDSRRSGHAYDAGSQTDNRGMIIKQRGHHTMQFEMPLGIFNNGEFKIYATLRAVENPGEDPEMIAFTNNDNCGYFAIRNERNGEAGMLSSRAIQINRLD
ncbi:ABC transporter ATP-binding protein [Bifidobacterium imperatoris]|uniref:ABC transporter ATP-binding protein n=1 Tax=Bifidobacterium imperatoris TaxID=2020965 RepID=A0A2N5IPH0_9BIFI|nr:ABC transporter ATP-binding protein [Bifidobacterium imperatoris]PLS23860.1 sugar ABC transporter [Bifidobacterium imperatoris]QSY58247.1 ABC transporter ATP-binding protein [Bifidobacterium imperatoris]